MTETRAADPRFVRVVRRLAVLALTVLLACVVLSSHHDEAAATVVGASHASHSTSTGDAAEATTITSAIATVGGCALFVVCCLLALALFRRGWRPALLMAGRQADAPTRPFDDARGTVWATPRPRLVALSISRT